MSSLFLKISQRECAKFSASPSRDLLPREYRLIFCWLHIQSPMHRPKPLSQYHTSDFYQRERGFRKEEGKETERRVRKDKRYSGYLCWHKVSRLKWLQAHIYTYRKCLCILYPNVMYFTRHFVWTHTHFCVYIVHQRVTVYCVLMHCNFQTYIYMKFALAMYMYVQSVKVWMFLYLCTASLPTPCYFYVQYAYRPRLHIQSHA